MAGVIDTSLRTPRGYVSEHAASTKSHIIMPGHDWLVALWIFCFVTAGWLRPRSRPIRLAS
jgi:hypothetical protein